MDIAKRLEELRAQHAEQAQIYQAAEAARERARVNIIKLEGAIEILQEMSAEPSEEVTE